MLYKHKYYDRRFAHYISGPAFFDREGTGDEVIEWP